MLSPGRWILTECVQSRFDCEIVKIQCHVLANFDEYFVNLHKNSDQILFYSIHLHVPALG